MIHKVPCVANFGMRRVGRPLCSGVGERGTFTAWSMLAQLLVPPAPNDATGHLDKAIQTPGAPDFLRSVPRSLWRGRVPVKYCCVQDLAGDSHKLGAPLLGSLVEEFFEMFAILGHARGGEGIGEKGIFIKQRDGDGVEPLPVVRPQISAVAKSDLGKRLPALILIFRVARRREEHRVGGRGNGLEGVEQVVLYPWRARRSIAVDGGAESGVDVNAGGLRSRDYDGRMLG